MLGADMNLTALDLLLLVGVPLACAVLGTLLWRLAVSRVPPRDEMARTPPTLVSAARSRRAGRLAVHPTPETSPASPAYRR